VGEGPEVATDLNAVLAATAPFSSLGDDARERLVGACRVRSLPRRSVLVSDGAVPTCAYVLTRGHLTRSVVTSEGRRTLLNDTRPVTAFACAAAIDGSPHVGIVEAAEPSEVVFVPVAPMAELLQSEPAFALAMAHALAHSSVRQTQILLELMYPVPVRVARYLSRAAGEAGHGELAVSKASLAASLGIAPETLSRALAALRADGLVDVAGREVRVLDHRRLAAFAQL
jgi:CRP-like cAMP-binding protein